MERGRQVARATGGVIAIIALLVGMVWFGQRINGNSDPRPAPRTLEQRVANRFGQYSTAAAEKFGGTPLPQPYVHVDTVTLSDGSHASLWVSDLPADAISRYMYLDVEAADGSFNHGIGGAGGPAEEVTLMRDGGALVGETGPTAAARVRIEGAGLSVEARVVRGFFLVAAPPTQGEIPSYTITLLDSDGGALYVANDVSPPD